MSKQKRTRSEAYDVAHEALNLAQDLSWLSEVQTPDNMKLSTKMSRKKLLEIMNDQHKQHVANTKNAYALVELIGKWADEYPLIKDKDKKEKKKK